VFPAKEIPFPQRCRNKIPFTLKKNTATKSVPATLREQILRTQKKKLKSVPATLRERIFTHPKKKLKIKKLKICSRNAAGTNIDPPKQKKKKLKSVPATMREQNPLHTEKQTLPQICSRNHEPNPRVRLRKSRG
jgi:hypothetical protein